MSIAAYIKVIGRGKDGARPLDSLQARDLFEQVLDKQVTDLEIGAFCLAMRIKGESVEELDGFVQASLARCLPLSTSSDALQGAAAHGLKGIVVLPSYNGARKLPNLTALLAWTLARRGVGVLVHGASIDPTRVTTRQVFDALGLPVAQAADDMLKAWRKGLPAFMDIATLCPPLGQLLAVRWTIGLRNPGHTVAKLLDPFAAGGQTPAALPSIRVVNHTHPEYAHSLTGYLRHCHADALLMRGTEGEPVADARRQPKFDIFIGGERDEALSRAPVAGVLTELPDLPVSHDAPTTAAYIRDVIDGHQPLPASIDAQADCLIQALARLSSRTEPTSAPPSGTV